MSNTVINIYGDVTINIDKRVNFDGSLSDVISTSVSKMISDRISNQIEDKIDERIDERPRYNHTSKAETPCYDYYGRWSNEAQRDAWRRFYRANGV